MKSYGVNWFLVWVGILFLFAPLFVWIQDVVFFSWTTKQQMPALVQAFAQSCCWTIIYYVMYIRTLNDPLSIERLRQSLEKTRGTRRQRHLIVMWAVMVFVVTVTSWIFKMAFHQLPWLHLVGYSLLVPFGAIASWWLLELSAKNGQLAQKLRDSTETPS